MVQGALVSDPKPIQGNGHKRQDTLEKRVREIEKRVRELEQRVKNLEGQ
jgi:hypothetical protein